MDHHEIFRVAYYAVMIVAGLSAVGAVIVYCFRRGRETSSDE